jgi:hypothetical protein
MGRTFMDEFLARLRTRSIYVLALTLSVTMFVGTGLAGEPLNLKVRKIKAGVTPRLAIKAGDSMWVTQEESLGRIDPETNEMVDRFRVIPKRFGRWRDDIVDVVGRRGRLWVAAGNRRVYEINPKNGNRKGNFKSHGHIDGLFFADGSLWYIAPKGLVRVHPKTYKVQARIEVPGNNTNIQAVENYDGYLWLLRDHAKFVAGPGGRSTWRVTAHLWQVNPKKNKVVKKRFLASTLAYGPVNPVVGDMVEHEGSLWFSMVYERRVLQMNPYSGRIRDRFSLPDFELPWEMSVAEDKVWVADIGRSQIARIDPDNGSKRIADVERRANSMTGGFGSLWSPFFRAWDSPGKVFRFDS